ncbi:MAG: signal recognition particle-docking protein FtsY [Deltaproteobacteria bacterium]
MTPLAPALAALLPFIRQNEALLIAVAVIVLVALLLLGYSALSDRASTPPSAPPKPPPEAPPPAPPPPKAAEANVEEPAPPPQPERSPEERRRLKGEEEERKRAAYRARKEQESREREEKRAADEERRRREAEEASRRAEEADRQRAEEEAARQRRIQAEAGKTLAEGLAKTRGGFGGRLSALFGGEKTLGPELLGQLEELLFSADVGVKTATRLLGMARDGLERRELTDPEKIKAALRAEIARIVDLPLRPLVGANGAGAETPAVWMIVGVNGVGKTTTIGKLAARLAADGQKVVLGAADTFRAAATEQLAIWAERAGAELVRGPEGSDPGSVAFEAVKRAKETHATVAVIDTAGRLHTKAPLMDELKKVQRVLGKARAGAPDEVLLVLDATVGQNAIAQARQFHETLGVTGIALTKLDGTAKGGVIIGICDELQIPIRYVGIGETARDLRPFDPKEYVQALFD